MKKLVFKYVAIAVVALLPAVASTQNVFKLDEQKSKLQVTGTSTVHDWEMNVGKFDGKTFLEKEETGKVTISEINFECPVDEIKSDNSIMDGKAHKALKEDKFPTIVFNLKNDQNIQTEGNESYLNGQLTIAGKTKAVKVPVKIDFSNNDHFTVSGNVPLKMSDFNIEPPTAMLGALKTGDEIVIKYNLEFSKTNGELSLNKK